MDGIKRKLEISEEEENKEKLLRSERLKLLQSEAEEKFQMEKRRLEAEQRLLEEKRLHLEAEQRLLEAEQRLLEAEQRLLEEKRLRLEAENRVLKAEKQINTMKDYQIKSLSYPIVYAKYLEDSEQTNFENLNLPHVEESKIISSWNVLIPELPEFGDGSDEKAHVHPFITKTLQNVINTFNLVKIKFHYESRLNNPDHIPDFSLSSSQISEPSWLDCLSFIECNATNVSTSDGGGQAITYMINMIFRNDDLLDFSNAPEMTFSAHTNGRSIQFFMMKKMENDELKKYHSANLNLFNFESEVDIPSDGFKLLCRILSFLGCSPITSDVIKIAGRPYEVIKTFQKSRELIVGLINVDGEGKCVAKYAIDDNKSTLFAIRKDAYMYKLLKDSPVKTLNLSSISDSNHLVFKEVGLCDLKSWSNDLLFKRSDLKDDNERFEIFVRCFIQVFEQIEKLHAFGYTHSDIKPANILILEGDTPCLIDFVTATKHGTKIDWIQGTFIFMAKDLSNTEVPYIFKRKYDIESFCYSLLYCADKHFSGSLLKPQTEDVFNFEFELVPDKEYTVFVCLREKKLSKLRESQESFAHFLNPRFVNLFFNLFDKLAEIEGDLNVNNYDELRNILENSIILNKN